MVKKLMVATLFRKSTAKERQTFFRDLVFMMFFIFDRSPISLIKPDLAVQNSYLRRKFKFYGQKIDACNATPENHCEEKTNGFQGFILNCVPHR